jgi:hypothetical protein
MNLKVLFVAVWIGMTGLNGLVASPLLDQIEKLPAGDLWDLRACEVVYDGGSLSYHF